MQQSDSTVAADVLDDILHQAGEVLQKVHAKSAEGHYDLDDIAELRAMRAQMIRLLCELEGECFNATLDPDKIGDIRFYEEMAQDWLAALGEVRTPDVAVPLKNGGYIVSRTVTLPTGKSVTKRRKCMNPAVGTRFLDEWQTQLCQS